MRFIIHHYPLSPFAEKIRAMLGYADLDWDSCLTSEAPPRGKLDWLTGGYGRIPVAQLGADIFCDTNLIADEIAKLSKQPALANNKLKGDELAQRQWFESKLFFAAVNRAFSISFLGRIAKEKGPFKLAMFLKDRIQMGAKATISMGSPKSAPKYIRQAMDEIGDALGYQDFLGGDTPKLLDFSAYHAFWFLTEVGGRDDLAQHQLVRSWYQRMHAFSSRPETTISIEEAINIARESKPRKLQKRYLQDHRIGSQITISPSDYRRVPVSGILAGVDDERWIVLREDSRTGPVHVHFPTKGVDVSIRLQDEPMLAPA